MTIMNDKTVIFLGGVPVAKGAGGMRVYTLGLMAYLLKRGITVKMIGVGRKTPGLPFEFLSLGDKNSNISALLTLLRRRKSFGITETLQKAHRTNNAI